MILILTYLHIPSLCRGLTLRNLLTDIHTSVRDRPCEEITEPKI